MKRKFLAKAITLGLMLAVPLSAYAKDATGVIINNVDGKTASDVSRDVKITLEGSVVNFDNIHNNMDQVIGIGNLTDGETIEINSLSIKANNINFDENKITEEKTETEVIGLHNLKGNTTINKDVNIKLNAKVSKDDSYIGLFGIRTFRESKLEADGTYSQVYGDGHIPEITIGGDVNIDISGAGGLDSYLSGIILQDNDGTKLTLGRNTFIKLNDTNGNSIRTLWGIETQKNDAFIKANNIEIDINGGQEQQGFHVVSGEVLLNNLDINLTNASTKSIGFNSGSANVTLEDLNVKISNTTEIDDIENVVAVKLQSDHNTNVSGNVNIDVENGYAINADTGLIDNFELGKLGTKAVKIKGDINTAQGSTGAIILNLNNAQSSLEGTTTGKVDLNLKEKSIWTNTGASTVNNLTLNGANLVQGNDTATITKANGGNFTISGNNTIALNTTSNGSTMSAGTKLFEDDAFANGVAEKITIKLTSANQNAADISKDKAGESFDNLLKALGDSNLKSKVTSAHLDGSYTTNAIYAVAKDGSFANGTITQSDADTETVAAIKKLPSINLISWRTENNELSKRLGEVRDYAGEEGIWARMNHGESKYLDSFKTKAHLYQMGYDKKVGEWRLGGAVSYNKGTATYENGNGKNRSTSLALYGAWLGDKGHYADIIVKEGKQKSELTIGQTGLAASNLDYDLWATSISAEYGRKIALQSDWFVEPQAELTYGRLGSADYGDNGFSVHQDSMDSLVGRMGFRLGKNLSDASNIYMKASVLHEFCGDVDYSLTERTISKVSSADLGDTWYEVGVGGSAQIGKATYAYAGIEKTFGGDFSTPWQWNAGVRWSF